MPQKKMRIEIGQKLPEFVLQSNRGEVLTSKELIKGVTVVTLLRGFF